MVKIFLENRLTKFNGYRILDLMKSKTSNAEKTMTTNEVTQAVKVITDELEATGNVEKAMEELAEMEDRFEGDGEKWSIVRAALDVIAKDMGLEVME